MSPLIQNNRWEIHETATAPGTYWGLHLLLVTLYLQLKFIHQSLHPAQIFLVFLCLKSIGEYMKMI